MKTWIPAAALAFLCISCMPAEPAPATELTESGPSPQIPADQSGCEAAGGDWRREGRLGAYRCVVSYADAGQPCTDAAQCQGECRLADDKRPPEGQAVTGQCQANSSPFGCFTRVENGRAAATLCVD
ncbi:MAG: hypothetical protein ACI8U3_001542 [Brevundimonas sp.]|jgi:hypothetical protein|uniref:hypothetical protein n=1 Tax=Brevundimonas sp. TaxID=1871086 RepID=UPI0039E6F528